jgi:hypothetical protein
MNDRERDSGAWPGDVGDDESRWDESFFELAEQIERGEFPIEIPCTIDLPLDKLPLAVRPLESDDGAAPVPRFPPLQVKLRLDQPKLRDMAIEMIDEAGRQGRSKLGGLMLLARIDGNAFLDVAARHFAGMLARGDESLRSDTLLGEFVVDLQERGDQWLVQIVERTLAGNRAAGERLRAVILETLDEPACHDALGLLAVAELAERLERL